MPTNPFHDPAARSPIDPDVDLIGDDEPPVRDRLHWRLLVVVALGGMIGATVRFVIGETWPAPVGALPWATLAINVTGCVALGALMALIADREAGHPWRRPFWGTGVIGGYTTFSTYAVEVHGLLLARHPALGLGYLAASVVLGLTAVLAGRGLARVVRTGGRRREVTR